MRDRLLRNAGHPNKATLLDAILKHFYERKITCSGKRTRSYFVQSVPVDDVCSHSRVVCTVWVQLHSITFKNCFVASCFMEENIKRKIHTFLLPGHLKRIVIESIFRRRLHYENYIQPQTASFESQLIDTRPTFRR
jgi:hypothetical protein